MIKVVSTNKHEQNGVDGGRTHKKRHISKIKTFKRDSEAIQPFCKDLFNVKNNNENEDHNIAIPEEEHS